MHCAAGKQNTIHFIFGAQKKYGRCIDEGRKSNCQYNQQFENEPWPSHRECQLSSIFLVTTGFGGVGSGSGAGGAGGGGLTGGNSDVGARSNFWGIIGVGRYLRIGKNFSINSSAPSSNSF